MQRLLVIVGMAILTGCLTETEPSVIPVGGTRTVVFVCDGGKSISVDFAEEAALLKANGATSQLVRQPVASGFHYAGEGNDLRGKASDMTWTDSAGVVHQCHDQSPWNQPQTSGGPSSTRSGTSWRLVHFQSSDDAIGTIVPPNVQNYTLQIASDGTQHA